MDDLPAIITALGVLVVALTQFYIARSARIAAAAAQAAATAAQAVAVKVEAVHADVAAVGREVATGNGQTIGMLADLAEGRAAQAIPESERTASEQTHVDMKEAAEFRGEQ